MSVKAREELAPTEAFTLRRQIMAWPGNAAGRRPMTTVTRRTLGLAVALFAIASPIAVVEADDRPTETFTAPTGDYVIEFPGGQPDEVGNDVAGVPGDVAFDLFLQVQGEIALLTARTEIPGGLPPVDQAISLALEGMIGVGGQITEQVPVVFRGASGADIEGTLTTSGVQSFFLGRILIRGSVLYMVLVNGTAPVSFKDPTAASFFGSFEFVKGVYR